MLNFNWVLFVSFAILPPILPLSKEDLDSLDLSSCLKKTKELSDARIQLEASFAQFLDSLLATNNPKNIQGVRTYNKLIHLIKFQKKLWARIGVLQKAKKV